MSERVVSLVSGRRDPVEGLVERLEEILELAKSGELRSFFGAGTLSNGDVLSTRGPSDDQFSDLGALEVLKARILAGVLDDEA